MNNSKELNISFLNLAAQSPSLELNLSLSEKIHRSKIDNKHIVFMCDKALKSCSVNILNKKSICNLCTYKAKKGFDLFSERNPNSELIKISRNDLINQEDFKISNRTKKEILFGVHSTIGSQLRLDDMSLLNKRWKKLREKCLNHQSPFIAILIHFLRQKM